MKLPIYIVDGSGNGVASLVLSGSEVQVSIDGAAPVNATGTVSEVGGSGLGQGAYVYDAQPADFAGRQLVLRVLDSGGTSKMFAFTVPTPLVFDFAAGATGNERRIMIVLVDSSGVAQTGKTPSSGELQVSLDGSTWTNGAGTWHEAGGGIYYYDPHATEAANDALLLVKSTISGTNKVIAWAFIGGGTYADLTPTDGAEISPDPDIARWTKVTATVAPSGGRVPVVVAVIGSFRWTVYDGTITDVDDRFAPFFREHSSITANGDGTYDLELLPNGGWWRTPFEIRLLEGSELVAA